MLRWSSSRSTMPLIKCCCVEESVQSSPTEPYSKGEVGMVCEVVKAMQFFAIFRLKNLKGFKIAPQEPWSLTLSNRMTWFGAATRGSLFRC